MLHFYADLSVGDIAGALGIPPGTAKSRLHYAITALRATLDAQERIGDRALDEARPA